MSTVKWHWECPITESRGTVQAPSNDADLALVRARKQHERRGLPGACMRNNPCFHMVVHGVTRDVWVQDTGRVDPSRLGVMRKLSQQEVRALDRGKKGRSLSRRARSRQRR